MIHTVPPSAAPASPLVIVTGRPGSGKSTLSRQLAAALGCPLVSRDEIFEGIRFAALLSGRAEDDDTISTRAFAGFFSTIRLMTASGVVCVAEAAFQHDKWLRGLAIAGAVVPTVHVHCRLDAALALSRVNARRERLFQATALHPALTVLAVQPKRAAERMYEPLSLPCPTITVDTANGYDPSVDQILDFIVAHTRSSAPDLRDSGNDRPATPAVT